ncbi:MAG: ATP-binding protein [Oscillospiraceae bacterium]|nr:ATP-binding protein [Oscillospiraceae bacterium]
MNSDVLISAVLNNAVSNMKRRDGDYERDGILYCGKCGCPKQAYIDWLPDENGVAKKRLVPIVCQCDKDEDKQNAEKAEQERFNVSLRRLRSTVDAAQAKWTFDDDDAAESSVSKALRKYAARWEDMKLHNEGILLYGNKGTGKSFYASCLVNELVQKRQTAAFVPVAGLMSTLQGSWSRQEIIEALCRFQLLALDDLGAERETSYSAELLYTVIDARYRVQKPTIITTNLDLAEMRNETDLLRSRIYDRVIEMCPITIDMVGTSRRAKLAEDRKQIARDLLR